MTANFKKLLPYAKQNNARIIAVNRRDYPGSAPYTADEQAFLARLASTRSCSGEAASEMEEFFRARARELYDYLFALVKREDIPSARGKGKAATGGIVLAGWSFGVTMMTAFLANVASFSSEVQLSKYVRRVVFYGTCTLSRRSLTRLC